MPRTSHRRSSATAALVAVVGLLLSACTSLGETNDNGYIPGTSQVVEYAVDERGEPVEGVSGTSLEGEPIELADSLGTVTVVNVWWSGCAPCVKEMPMLAEAHAELGDTVDFLGINTRDPGVAQAKAFQESAGVEYPSIYGQDGTALLAFGGRVPSMPSTVVLDRDGRIAALINGEIPSKLTLTSVVEKVLAEDG